MSICVDIEKKLGEFHLKAKFQVGNETLSLLGASGCGKTMMLKCIAGIEKPDKGRIVIDERVVFDSEKGINLSPQKRQVGLLFQNYALFPNMTVLQNVQTGAKREKDKTKRDELVQKMIESFGLSDLASHFPSQLSGGQQQRVALARILVSNPDILLLDEPFSALDSHLRFQMEQEVRQVIKKFGKTVILVSHDRDEVYRMTDQIAVMNVGNIEAYGDKKSVFAAPCTKTGALLTGCKNISSVKMLGDHHILAEDWGVELKIREDIDFAEYIGIRMHDITIDGLDNCIHCNVVEEIENPFSYIIMLNPCGVKNLIPIAWETDKSTWLRIRAKEIDIYMDPNAILVLNKIC